MKNVILLMTDEERAVPPYDDPEMYSMLKTRSFLERNAVSFTRHYTASTACVPSRASIMTGLPVYRHGCSQTPGYYKEDGDPNIMWLSPTTKTIGHYFRELGYTTYYVGKWHLTENPTPEEVNGYGFSMWMGPEPHGPEFSKAGVNNDHLYIQQAVDILENVSGPFMMVISLVNPHDIVLYPKFSIYNKSLPIQTHYRFDESAFATMNDEPALHAHYDSLYKTSQVPVWMHDIIHKDHQRYRNFYHSLLHVIDQHTYYLLQYFITSRHHDTTTLIYTSDHGDMVGTKGMYQKWYSAYDEVTRVPLYIYDKHMVSKQIHSVTSSLDLLPTMLCIAGAHNPMYHGTNVLAPIPNDRVVQFHTFDDVFSGSSRYPVYYRSLSSILKCVFLPLLGVNRVMPLRCGKHVSAYMGYIDGSLYKYICYHSFGYIVHEQLFNMNTDPCERNNIIRMRQDIANNLKTFFMAKL